MPRKTSIKEAREAMGNPAFIAGVIVVGIVFIFGAVIIGKSDSGEINVTAAIENANNANTAAGGDASRNVETIPESFKNMTNGGLVPQENQPEPVVAEPIPETVPAEVSTTTEEGADTQADEGTTDTQLETTENAGQ